MKFYHGTTGDAARKIAETGEFKPQEGGRGYLEPIGGRVYVTRSKDEALKYAVFRSGWHIHRPEEAGLVSIVLRDPNMIWPDEDDFGRVIALGYLDMTGSSGRLSPEETDLFNHIWYRLRMDYKEKMERIDRFRLDEYAYWAMLGKRALKQLSVTHPEFIRDIVDKFDNVSTPPGNIIMEDVRVFSQEEGTGVNDHWSPHLKNVLNSSERILARGAGKGWWNEPARHALASRGVRTR